MSMDSPARARANGIELAYEDRGPADAPAILLIIGLGTQMTRWPPLLIDALLARGFRVVRFDNRDIGLSTHLDDAAGPVAYTLGDMARDAVGLMDALGIDRAHLVGASMGGMIAQIVAATRPDRTLSLTSVMSSSGNPDLPGASEAVLALLASPRPDPADEDAIVERIVLGAELMGSPGYPVDRDRRRAAARADYRRSYHPAGVLRHTAAIAAARDRRPLLRTITAPTTVIHGSDDPLLRIEAGRDTAANIPGAQMIEIAGMGHDVPDALIPTVVDAIVALAARTPRPAPVSLAPMVA